MKPTSYAIRYSCSAMYPFTINYSVSVSQLLNFEGVEELYLRLYTDVSVPCTLTLTHLHSSFFLQRKRFIDVICNAIKLPQVLSPWNNFVLYSSHVFSNILYQTSFKKCLSCKFCMLQAKFISNV